MGEAPDSITLIETVEDLDNVQLPKDKPIAVLTQTTLAVDETQAMIEAIKKRFPSVVQPRAKDICFATTNRQKAVKELAKVCDLILVVGSANSSNSNRLAEVARSHGVKSLLIDDVSNLTIDELTGVKSLGITAGASAPEFVVQNLLTWIRQHYETDVHTLDVGSEEANFTLTKDIREMDSL